ncbi:polysaccharide biosynthesis tyrosine autokinase [Naasia sp. SYSU D00057]|uniref:polysaccharide biosynthesis tyrosine autokinase n=1 Tax=Naasia sp. SYSU D00057 TaxID=2817380 RepID=UPI001B30D010|nr:polysaccharide biosynthesis tyrosine autokinase [Naasia sp. SYSU D00057]
MDPRRYLLALRKHWAVLVGLTIVGGLLAGLYAATQPVLYQATSSVFLSTQRGETTQELVQGGTYTLDSVQSYADLAVMPKVLDPVIDELGLDTTVEKLATQIETDIRLNTVIIEVTATADSAEGAAELANAITDSLALAVADVAPKTGGDNPQPAVSLQSVAEAQAPSAPFSPRYFFLIASGAALGLLLAIAYAVIRDLFDTRFRTEDEAKAAAAATGAPFLGGVERRHGQNLPHLVILAEPNGRAAEDYRRLCTNLEFAGVDRRVRSMTVTSALPGDGKTTTALNVAGAIAERGHRVLLVDADLRRPAVAAYVNIEGSVGLTNVLLGGVSAEDAIQQVGTFDVLPSGTTPPNVTQVLSSESMARLFAELQARYDYVVVDSPPVLAVPDALTIAHLTDGALIVARQKVTRSKQLAEAAQSLTFVGANVLGVVLNGVARRATSSYGYETVERGDESALRPAATPPKSFFREDAAVEAPAVSQKLADDEDLAKVAK